MKFQPKTRAGRFIHDIVIIYAEKRIPRTAAELAYFLTLSVFPFLICLNAMLGTLNLSEESLISLGEGIIPEDALTVLGNYVEYISRQNNTILLVAGLTLMASSSSAAFRSIMNIMADIQGKSRFSGIFGTLFSFALSVVFLAVIYVSGLVIVLGGWFMQMLDEQFGIGRLLSAWLWIRFVILFFMMYVIIYGIYVISAPRQKPRMHKTVGALLASVLLVAASIVFSWFINMSVNYTLVYGSLASIIILMIWLYTCGIILIMGNVINIVIHRHMYEKQLPE